MSLESSYDSDIKRWDAQLAAGEITDIEYAALVAELQQDMIDFAK